jgi:hypothetical protein
MVLDFRPVVALNTCVAEFLAKQAQRLAQARPRVYMIVVGVHVGSEIHVRLTKGGIDCDWDSANSLQGLRKESFKTRVFDSREQFLRISHAAGPKEACISYTTSSATYFSLGTGANSTYINDIMQKVMLQLPRTDLSIEQCMVKYGLTLGEILPGHAVSCTWYAYKPIYLVLQGEIIIRNGHDASNRIQQPVRAACSRVVSEAFQWCSGFFGHAITPQASQDAPGERLMSLDVYDKHSRGNSCAHPVKRSCWVLFVDPESIVAEGGWMFEGDDAEYVPSLRKIAASLRENGRAAVAHNIK